ncbi:MAG: bifunctional lysylphosphatidylglycerol flippase/synthetase MprF [Gammaproteobacteria bacterium]
MRKWLAPSLTLIVFVVVLLILERQFHEYHLRDVIGALRTISTGSVLAAVGFTVLSYISLTLFDALGLRYAGKPLPYHRTVGVSFIAYAFAHSFSFAALTGAAIRYRFYSPAGLSAVDVARVSAFTSVTTGVGISLLGGLALLLSPSTTGAVLRLPAGWALVAGAGIVLGVLAYTAWGCLARNATELWNWRIDPPGIRLVVPQLFAGLADLIFSAAALWVLLPESAAVGFPAFCGAYAAAIVAGLVTHVPGGLGVLEAVLLVTIPHGDPAAMLGALAAYRLVYYILPLLMAALMFALKELAGQLAPHGARMIRAARWLQQGSPQLLGCLVFLAGAVLLVSGATPAVDNRLAVLRHVLPLPVLETSHLAGSVIGLSLLVLARALFARVNAAYHLTFALLLAGVAASLLKGLDYEEALILGLVLGSLWLARRQFYRRATLWQDRFGPGWTLNMLVVIGTAIWIGFLTHRQVPYSNELWWTFAVNGDAPRMLRASLLVVVIAAAVVLTDLLKPAQPEPGLPGRVELERARKIIGKSTSASANLALSGDKNLLFSDDGQAFLMYRIAGRSWIALGDPVCDSKANPEAGEELLWRFREMVSVHGGRTVIYEVSSDHLPLYLDLGLTLTKLGEEARVFLPEFSLEGRPRAELRSARRRAEREGATFEIVMPDALPPLFPILQKISDHWLEDKATTEKGFSLGFFSPEYLQNFPIAIIRVAGMPVAFANLWVTTGREELSVDLMRFGPDAPHGAMDYLFTELLLWGKAQGYRYLNLGMTPLAGLESHPLAPAWHRVGNLVFRYGDHFYNFSGLRRYKAKFLPEWQPRYLASPGGFALPHVLLDVATLISGGVRGLWSRVA